MKASHVRGLVAVATLSAVLPSAEAGWNIAKETIVPNPVAQNQVWFSRKITAVGTNSFAASQQSFVVGTNQGVGVVYVFDANSGALTKTITNPAPSLADNFGGAVACFNTNKLLIGAFGESIGTSQLSGVVYIYNTNGTLQTTVPNPTPGYNDQFGQYLGAISTDRFVVLKSSGPVIRSQDCAYVYNASGTLLATITNSCSAIAKVGTNRFVLGSPAFVDGTNNQCGRVFMYDLNGALVATITNPAPAGGDLFGRSLCGIGANKFAVGADQDTRGAPFCGAAFIYDINGTLLVTITNPIPNNSDFFGISVAAAGTNVLAVGAWQDDTINGNAGTVYFFDMTGKQLTQANVTNGNNYLGANLASLGGDKILAGAYGEPAGALTAVGAVHMYTLQDMPERYGFENGTQGWAVSSDTGSAAVVSIATATNWSFRGTNSLRLNCDLRAVPVANQKGEAEIDMDKYPPFAVPVPINLNSNYINMKVFCPTGSAGTNSQLWAHHQLAVFVKDQNGNALYDTGRTIPVDNSTMFLSLYVSTNTPMPFGFKAPGFDPTKIRYVGVKFLQKTEGGPYLGPLYMDTVEFPATTPSYVAPTNQRYSFDAWTHGWEVTTSITVAATSVVQTTGVPSNSTGVLRINFNMNGTGSVTHAGEAFVVMANNPAYGIEPTVNLSNRQVVASVYCPAGTRGLGTNPCGIQLFVKDTNFLAYYGSWTYVLEGSWMSVTVTPNNVAATNGFMQPGFDPAKIGVIGVKYGAPPGAPVSYSGPIYLDGVGFTPAPSPAIVLTNQKYSFDIDAEGFVQSDYTNSLAITSVVRTTSVKAAGAGALQMNVNLVATNAARNNGEVSVDMQWWTPNNAEIPINLLGQEISAYVFSAAGSRGTNTAPNAYQLYVKDDQFRSEYGTWTPVYEGVWQKVKLTPATTAPTNGLMTPGFDPTKIRILGLKYAAGTSNAVANFTGPLYLDVVSFTAPSGTLQNLRYGFEPNKEGWVPETFTGQTAITAVQWSTNRALEGTHALKVDVNISSTPTNKKYGATWVDTLYYPPPSVNGPFDLLGQKVFAYVYCPVGAQGGNPLDPNQIRFFVKDENFKVEYGAGVAMQDGDWVRVQLIPTTNTAPQGGYIDPGFNPRKIRVLGIEVGMVGSFSNSLYVDYVSFPATTAPMPATQHAYSFEAPSQSDWWKWDTDPVGWNAYAWSNVYYATNQGYAGSVALAANAVFAGTNAPLEQRKGVFKIEYNPPLNLSTKDHRKIQAKLRFSPPVEGVQQFSVSINVFDKNTDQWYWKTFNAGGSGWNVLDYNLDLASEYAAGSPPGPMDPSAIGFITIQIFGNTSWTGTIYLDDVVVGGNEIPGVYNMINGGFVKTAGRDLTLNGTNLYFCGANIEYLFSVSDKTCAELLDASTNMHLAIVRTWAFHEGQVYSFQPQRGVWNELAFEHLDRIVAMAGHRGLRLWFGLADNWAHNGGMFKYLDWALQEHPESINTNFTLGSVEWHDQFYSNQWCQLWYQNFVTKLMNRTNSITGRQYKNDPTVAAYEIVNEPRAETVFQGGLVHSWLWKMSDFVRSINTNHLLGSGEEGGYIKTFAEANGIPWETYPDNYYHYGLHSGVGEDACGEQGCGRGHGVDLISDHSSASNFVMWQMGTATNPGQIYGEWRPGVSNINFATFRIYADEKEYNLYRTNSNGYDQREEWFFDHVQDAHTKCGKPVLMGEFGIHGIGWVYHGSFGQIQYKRTPEYSIQDRVNAYQKYYDLVEDLDVSGSFFWNIGYSNMWEDLFNNCDSTTGWFAEAGSAATSVSLETNIVKTTNSLKLSYSPGTYSAAIYSFYTNAQWVVRENNGVASGINRVKFIWNFYNPNPPMQVALALKGTKDWLWAESPPQNLTTGWNKITFDLSAATWKAAQSGWQYTYHLIDIWVDSTNVLQDVHAIYPILYGLTNGAGSVYMDDITIKRDDGFVIYIDDPVVSTIRNHADRMAAKKFSTRRSINGTISYGGTQTGAVRVTATPAFGSPTTVSLASPGPYGITDLINKVTYDISAFRDVNGNGVKDASEASGLYAGNPLYLTSNVTGINITLADPNGDSDSDGLPDAWENQYFGNLGESGTGDPDGDGFLNYYEYVYAKAPNTATSTPAATIFVDAAAPAGGNGSSTNPFNTIQAAVNVATNLSIINLAPGTYKGTGNRNVSYLGKPVMIRAGIVGSVVLDAEAGGSALLFQTSEGSYSVARGLVLRGASSGAVVCSSASPTILDCSVEHNSSSGIRCVGPASAPAIRRCAISGNVSARDGGGVYASNASPTLASCVIAYNRSRGGGGIFLHGSPAIIQNCTIIGNSTWQPDSRVPPFDGYGGFGAGIAAISSSPQIVNCTLYTNVAKNTFGNAGAGGGVYVSGGSPALLNSIVWENFPNSLEGGTPTASYSDVEGGWAGTGNISTNPMLNFGRYSLKAGSPCIDAGSAGGAPATDRESDARWDDPTRPNIASTVDIGADEFTGVALDDMSDADADGYPAAYEFIHATDANNAASKPVITWYINAAAAAGGNGSAALPFQTIGDALSASASYDILQVADGVYTGVMNAGWNVTRPLLLASQNGPANCILDAQNSGIGISLYLGSSRAILRGITVRNAGSAGVIVSFSGPLIEGCDIRGNAGGGVAFSSSPGIYSWEGVPTMRNCTIRNNSSTNGSGGVSMVFMQPVIENCVIVSNSGVYGGGLRSYQAGISVIRNCEIKHNSAWYGAGAFVEESSLLFENCVIARNAGAISGGGGYVMHAAPTFQNCTIASNSAPTAGAFSFYQGSGYLYNSIVWGNGTNAIAEGSPTAVAYSDVQGGWTGTGNINADPRLLPNTFALDDVSPCIDAGTSSNAPALDRDGQARWDDPYHANVASIYDIGADEFVNTLTNGFRYDFEAASNISVWSVSPFAGLYVFHGTGVAWSGSASLGLYVHLAPGYAYTYAKTDLQANPPPGVASPMNLEGRTLSVRVYCPPGSSGGAGSTPNQLTFRAYDTNSAMNYSLGPPVNMVDGSWVQLTWTFRSTGSFNAASIRYLGIDVNYRQGSYDGPIYMDYLRELPPESTSTTTNLRYDFESALDGWYWSYGSGLSGVQLTSSSAFTGLGSMQLNVTLDGKNVGEVQNNLDSPVLPGLPYPPYNLANNPIKISFYCPTGSRGSATYPNIIQLFYKNSGWTWIGGPRVPIVENQWVTLDHFAGDTRAIGVAIESGTRYITGVTNPPYNGPIYMDTVRFAVP